MAEKLELKMVKHYSAEYDQDCNGDYHYAEIYLNNGLVVELQGYSDDFGEEQLKGMETILSYLYPMDDIEIMEEKIADSNY